jgi:hypothetical protein
VNLVVNSEESTILEKADRLASLLVSFIQSDIGVIKACLQLSHRHWVTPAFFCSALKVEPVSHGRAPILAMMHISVRSNTPLRAGTASDGEPSAQSAPEFGGRYNLS